MRNFWLFFILILMVGCKQLTEKEKLARDLTGDWIFLYPDHQIKNSTERTAYAAAQDSIVSLSGLKLIRFMENGRFEELDSINTAGKWSVSDDMQLHITGAGKGFNEFKASFFSFDNDLMQLKHFIELKGATIKVLWHMKKIRKEPATALFRLEDNAWRVKPTHAEKPLVMRKRISAMLRYYSAYFFLVEKESSFFLPDRVPFPMNYYQHAIGLRSFDPASSFSQLFYDSIQAKEAHDYLGTLIKRNNVNYKRGDNYVGEYADFMNTLSSDDRD